MPYGANNSRVVILAPTGRDASAVVDVIGRAGMSGHCCDDITSLVQELDRGAGAAFVAEEALRKGHTTALENWIIRQPPWSDLPVVVLTSRLDEAAIRIWRESVIASLRNVTLLERPVQSVTLVSALRAALRSRSRQYELKTYLDARDQAAAELERLVVERTSELRLTNERLREQMAERDRIAEHLRHAQKMEAIGQLTGGIAHDFNNLLMVMSGGLSMLDRRPDRHREILDAMQKATTRGARLTHQLLAFSRRQDLKPEAIDLRAYFGDLADLLDRSLRGDVTVVTDIATDLWPVSADSAELQLVILNLAVNARDAMPHGGEIVITARNQILDGIEFIRISVRDQGTGMTPETLSRVFEPFFTTKEIGHGSGLGLAQVHGFVTQSGGKVEIDTALGKGTTVSILLPRADHVPSAPPARTPSAPGPVTAKGDVLVVEDEDTVASLVMDMLQELGYRAIRSTTASAALDMLRTAHVDVVFSDVMMPGDMDGVQLSREIRARYPETPVLLTSGYAEVIRRAADTEGVRILPKPYQLEELGAALERLKPAATHERAFS